MEKVLVRWILAYEEEVWFNGHIITLQTAGVCFLFLI